MTPALIPAFSPGEKEKRSPVFAKIERRRWRERRRAIRKWTAAVPAPWGLELTGSQQKEFAGGEDPNGTERAGAGESPGQGEGGRGFHSV